MKTVAFLALLAFVVAETTTDSSSSNSGSSSSNSGSTTGGNYPNTPGYQQPGYQQPAGYSGDGYKAPKHTKGTGEPCKVGHHDCLKTHRCVCEKTGRHLHFWQIGDAGVCKPRKQKLPEGAPCKPHHGQCGHKLYCHHEKNLSYKTKYKTVKHKHKVEIPYEVTYDKDAYKGSDSYNTYKEPKKKYKTEVTYEKVPYEKKIYVKGGHCRPKKCHKQLNEPCRKYHGECIEGLRCKAPIGSFFGTCQAKKQKGYGKDKGYKDSTYPEGDSSSGSRSG